MSSAPRRSVGKKPKPKNGRWWMHLAFLGGGYAIAGCLVAAVVFGLPGLPGFLRPKTKVVKEIVRLPAEQPPLPPKFIPRKEATIAQLFSGVTYQTSFESLKGLNATTERASADSYTVDISVKVKVPAPNSSLETLAALNPDLPRILPGLGNLLRTAKPSDFYFALYDRKVSDVKASLQSLNRLLSRHNFYDCETILELQDPITRRKALVVQAEMDVVADGSDPDREFKVVGTYTHFQPMTSYRWPRRTKRSNPLIGQYEDRIAKYQAEIKDGPSKSRTAELKGAIEDARHHINDMRASSSLVAIADPFIVMPTFMILREGHPFRPYLGDYCAVIHGNTVYPAIVGDAGPSTKMGEASLRLAQKINPKATPYERPVDDLTITYIVFPGTGGDRKTWGPPNLALWRIRCMELLNEIGGCKAVVHEWEDLIKPPAPSPTPVLSTPTPATTAAPAVAPAPVTTGTGGTTPAVASPIAPAQ
jgi:hypothetical protein